MSTTACNTGQTTTVSDSRSNVSWASYFPRFSPACASILTTTAKIAAISILAFELARLPGSLYLRNHKYQNLCSSTEVSEKINDNFSPSPPVCLPTDESIHTWAKKVQISKRSIPSWIYDEIPCIQEFQNECLTQEEIISSQEACDFLLTGLERPPYLASLLSNHMPAIVRFYQTKDSNGNRVFSNIQEIYDLAVPSTPPSLFSRIFGLDIFDDIKLNKLLTDTEHLLNLGYSGEQSKNFLLCKNKVTQLVNEKLLKPSLKERKELLESIMDSVLGVVIKKPSIHRKIVISPKVVEGGFGDIVFGIKLTRIINEHFPNVEVALMVEDKYVKDTKFLCAQKFPEIADLVQPFHFNPNQTIDLQINGPARKQEEWLGNSARISLYEYGCRGCHSFNSPKSITHVAGLGLEQRIEDTTTRGEEIGIFIPQEPKTTSFHNISNLHNEGLKQKILGPYSLQEYNQKHSFYFGYCHKIGSAFEFIDTIAISADPSKDIDICLVGQTDQVNLDFETADSLKKSIDNFIFRLPLLQLAELKNFVFQDLQLYNLQPIIERIALLKAEYEIETNPARRQEIEERLKLTISYSLTSNFLKSKNFNDLFRVYVFSKKNEWAAQNIGRIVFDDIVFLTGQESERTLRYINAPRLDHQDMEILFFSSQPFTIVTGDQSVSDILVENPSKIFTYEVEYHKRKFFMDLVALAQPFGKAGQFFNFVAEKNSTAIGLLLRDNLPELIHHFRLFIKHIRRDRNIENFVVPMIERIFYLGHWYQTLTDDLENWDANNQELFQTHIEEFLQEIVDTCPAPY